MFPPALPRQTNAESTGGASRRDTVSVHGDPTRMMFHGEERS